MSKRAIDASGEDEAEFIALFEAQFADLWRFARRRCDSSQDADDATAETFAIAWRRRDAIPADNARPWLFGVARKVLANQRRVNERQQRVALRLVEERPSATSEDRLLKETLPPKTPPALREALGRLSPEQRELLIMQAWDGLSVGEMAEILECSANAVSLRLFKARRKLAHELGMGQEPLPEEKESEGSGHVATRSLP
jgi:RNA polymerase sigma factor (sigma-70 family)